MNGHLGRHGGTLATTGRSATVKRWEDGWSFADWPTIAV
jgi:hypothetical protein